MTRGEPRQDRSRATRRRLLDGAVRCLAEQGWSGATVARVAESAGVSRGAAQHHFRTREELVTAAVDEVYTTRMAQIRDRAAHLPDGPGRTRAIIEMLVDSYTGTGFRAALQLWTAASNDPELRDLIVPLEERVGREAHHAAVDLLGVDDAGPGVRETIQATLDLARGLGLANLLTDDAKRRERIVTQWAGVLERELG